MGKIKIICMYAILAILLFKESIQILIPINEIEYFDEIVVLVFTMIAGIKVFKNRKLSKEVIILSLLLLAFFVCGSISLYINSNLILSRYIGSAFLAIKCFLLLIDVCIIGFSNDIKKMFVKAINNIGIVCAVIGIFNFIFPNIYQQIFSFAKVTYRFGFVSVTSLFYHTSRFGWFMLFLALLNYSLYRSNKSKINRNLCWLFGIFSLFSFRTKVIISIIVIILLCSLLTKKIEIKKIIIAVIVGCAIFAIFNKNIMNTYHLYIDKSSGTVTARKSLTENSYRIVKEYFPLGVGFGKYGSWYARKYYSEYYYKYNMDKVYGLSPDGGTFATDTFWSAILGETGALGALFYIMFLVYILLKLAKTVIKSSVYPIGIYLGILVLVQSILESFGEPSFNSPPQYIFLAIIVGSAMFDAIKLKDGATS